MTSITTTSDLVFDPYDHDTIRDPHALFRRLREEAPLYHNDELGFYAVSRFDDVERVLLTRDTFISSHGVTLDMLLTDYQIPPGTLIFDEPPKHGIHRLLLSRMFTPKRVKALEPQIRQLCAQLMDPLVGSGGFDLVREVGSEIPMRVISMLLGIPESDQEAIHDRLGESREKDGAISDHALDGALFADYIDWRVDHPSDDIMSHLLHAEFEDENGETRSLDRDELLAYVNIIASAGNETTKVLIGWSGRLLAEHPEQRKILVEEPDLMPRAVEEVLRYEPNTLTNCRYASTDFEFYGTVVPAGSIVATLTPSAGRDERMFSDPDGFDVRREPGKHMYFGFGAHYCLGQALARLEGRVVLDELLKRFPVWDVDLDQAQFSYHADMRGYRALPITIP